MTASRRSVLWSSTSESTFLVSSASELRLCEYISSKASAGPQGRSRSGGSRVKTVAVCSDLPAFKSLAWSPDPGLDDLVAVGLNTGRTILLRINETPVYTSTSTPSILQLNVRQPRPCNVAAFSPNEPNLLVTGYDKVRDTSLLVWDLKDSFLSSGPGNSARKASLGESPASTSGSARPRPSSMPSTDFRPIAQYGQSEQVSAATFLYASKMLVASMAQKWIRCYDLRVPYSTSAGSSSTGGGGSSSSTNAAAVMNGRNVTSLVADPFDAHRFASLGDEGLVRMWDLRNHAEPLLTFSSEDGVAAKDATVDRRLVRNASKISLPSSAGAAAAGSIPVGAVASVQFSRTRRGQIATLDREANYLSCWNMFEVGDNHRPSEPTTPGSTLVTPSNDNRSDDPPPPTLYYERRTGHLSKGLTSFAFVPVLSGPQQFVTVNKDGQVEFSEVKQSPQLAFASSGQFVYSWESRFTVEGDHLAPKAVLRLPGTSQPSNATTGSLTPRHRSRDRLMSKIQNITSRPVSPDREGKGRKSGRGRTRHVGEEAEDRGSDEDAEQLSRIPLLENDISVTMRTRAEKGYGLDPLRNKKLSRDNSAITEAWGWVDHSAMMSANGRAFIDNYDFGFRGVLSILKGFHAHESQSASGVQQHPREQSSSSRRSRTVSQPSGPTVFEDVRSSIKRSDAARIQEAAFAKAAAALNRKNASTPFVITSAKPAQRQLALSTIGPDFASTDVSSVIKRYENLHQPSKAAAWALFSGNIELAVRSLKSNKDERLKLLAPILATYLSQRDQDGHTSFKELCGGLSTDLDDPFMRAIFAYISSGDWRDVLEEEGIGLRDRVGVALRFLPDEQLAKTLESMTSKAISSGDLEGLLLTGLDTTGVSLLQSYVDRTGDVQTAALIGAFVHPGQIQDARVEKWIESYRRLLDTWRLFTIRARFDIARGSKMRSSLSVKGVDENSVAIGALLAPPTMLIRCHFCNETIAPRKTGDGGTGSGVSKAPGPARRGTISTNAAPTYGRTTRCPHCSKSFPRCAICLESIEVSTSGKESSLAWAWCHRCRHGGHAAHFLEWFSRGNMECPVADCDCNCRKV